MCIRDRLQTTFVKALGDSSRAVRKQSLNALGQLVRLTSRVDPLISDLASGASSAAEPTVKETMLEALVEVLTVSGAKASPGVIEHTVALLEKLSDDRNEAVKEVAGRGLGESY